MSDNLKNRNTKFNYFAYLVIQFFIIIVPPLIATVNLEINHYINNTIEEYGGYTFGISGLLLIILLYLIGFESEIFVVILFLIIKFVIAFDAFRFGYKNFKNILIPILINLFISIWEVIFGVFWMFAAMQ